MCNSHRAEFVSVWSPYVGMSSGPAIVGYSFSLSLSSRSVDSLIEDMIFPKLRFPSLQCLQILFGSKDVRRSGPKRESFGSIPISVVPLSGVRVTRASLFPGEKSSIK